MDGEVEEVVGEGEGLEGKEKKRKKRDTLQRFKKKKKKKKKKKVLSNKTRKIKERDKPFSTKGESENKQLFSAQQPTTCLF